MAARAKKTSESAVIPGAELKAALTLLEEEKSISKETLFEAIRNSLLTAYKNHFKSADNVVINIDEDTCEFHVIATKEVIELADDVMDPAIEISWDDAKAINPEIQVGEMIDVEVNSKEFGRIATQNAKNVITQKIREEERNAIYNQFHSKEKDIILGTLQRKTGMGWNVNLGKTDAILPEGEMIETERYVAGKRMRFYVLEVKALPKGSKITVSRTHPELVKRLFEDEVSEIKDGIVEIMSIAREAGSRTKMAVFSSNPNIDPVGACVGINGARVNAIVDELQGEKIDIICYDDNPGNMIRNALSPAQIINVFADPDEMTANVVVPDSQLSLAIGKAGQNARLAAKLTGYKIDIKSETQAQDAYGFRLEDYMDSDEEYSDEDYEGEYSDENNNDNYNEDNNYSDENVDGNVDGNDVPSDDNSGSSDEE